MGVSRLAVGFLIGLSLPVYGMALSAGPAFAAGAPVVEDEYAQTVGITSAVLGAQINPNEVATTYRFEYGPDSSYGTSVPMTPASVGAGNSVVSASQALGGLQAGTSYHYRVVATNAQGTSFGTDHVFSTFSIEASSSDTCPNATLRGAQFSAYLPDCRAYEMVSPLQKNGGSIAADPEHTLAAVNGNAITYTSTTTFGDSPGTTALGAEYLSQRAADGSGWVTHGIDPPQAAPSFALYASSLYVGFSEDLSKGVYFARSPVLAGHPNVEHVANLYLRKDLLSAFPGSYELLNDSVNELAPRSFFEYLTQGIEFDGASADWSRLIFETHYNLTSDAPPQPQDCGTERELDCLPRLYEWHEGVVKLVGILPNGSAAQASVGGGGGGGGADRTKFAGNVSFSQSEHAISADGSRIIFTGGELTHILGRRAAGDLYMRINGSETIQLNVSERTDCADHNPCSGTPEPDPAGHQPAIFMRATPDDSKVLFLSEEELTNDTPAPHMNLYMYDLNAQAGKHLTLLSKGSGSERNGSSNASAVVGASEDLSYVYFVGNEQLSGQPPIAEGGEELYVWHDGSLRSIAPKPPLSYEGEEGWGEDFGVYDKGHEFRVTPDGSEALFIDASPQLAGSSGYDNKLVSSISSGPRSRGEYICKAHESNTKYYCGEAYLYNYGEGKIACVSCGGGASPASKATIESFPGSDFSPLLIASAPGQGTDHPLSRDGRYVFFNTATPLVPRDTNGTVDVYEYDTLTRHVSLVSNGTCDCGSHFLDASASGEDVFFVTHQSLVRADIDTDGDVYDARVNGGIPAQNQPPPAPCEGDDCQGPAKGTPGFSLPSSQTFSGPGNNPMPVGPDVKQRSKGLTKAQKAARALRLCRRRAVSHKARVRCEAKVRARYGMVRRASSRTGR